MNEQIEQRIKELTIERDTLDKFHREMVEENQKQNQQFQQQVVRNQTRFAQLTGAITELQQLTEGEQNAPINVNRSYATTSGDSNRLLSGVDSNRGNSGTDLGD